MRKPLKFTAIVLSIIFALSVQAQTPTLESTRQLLKNMGQEQNIAQMRQEMKQNILQFISAVNANMNDAEKQQLNTNLDKIMAVIMEEMTWQKLEPHLLKAMQNTYNQEEINAQIEFYNTPIGKSIASKNYAFMQNTLKANQDFQQILEPKIQEAMQQLK